MNKSLLKCLLGLVAVTQIAASEPRPALVHIESTKKTKLEEQLIKDEGYRTKVYLDTRGIPTVGVGFNLLRTDASNRLAQVGADYQSVRKGEQQLNDYQIMALLKRDITNAMCSARRLIKNYDAQPEEVKEIVLNMSYNLGENLFGKFRKTIAAIEMNDYNAAAREMQNSEWYKQVGNRGKYLVEKMRAAATASSKAANLR